MKPRRRSFIFEELGRERDMWKARVGDLGERLNALHDALTAAGVPQRVTAGKDQGLDGTGEVHVTTLLDRVGELRARAEKAEVEVERLREQLAPDHGEPHPRATADGWVCGYWRDQAEQAMALLGPTGDRAAKAEAERDEARALLRIVRQVCDIDEVPDDVWVRIRAALGEVIGG